ncbi:integrase/recombinase XerD [Paraburkholderia sp. Clong3]|uniref:tyrosine-type recombinase/integrase n=1 Tax=Paraburkholderia sp. Clong3 TaxID=2991061 RepID=UPI003D20AEF1
MNRSAAKVLTPAKFKHLVRVTGATSRFPERDTLILLLGVTCGMRVTEIARLEVHHVLTKSGARREEVPLPGSITKGCRARCVFLSHPRAIDAFDRFVEWRYRRGDGVALDRREYRGLMPRSRLILTQKGGPFELSVKRRVNSDGEPVDYWAADSLQSYVTALYRAAGLGAGYSSHSGRRTFATRLVANGHSLETVQILLGHSHLYASEGNVIFDVGDVGFLGRRPLFCPRIQHKMLVHSVISDIGLGWHHTSH